MIWKSPRRVRARRTIQGILHGVLIVERVVRRVLDQQRARCDERGQLRKPLHGVYNSSGCGRVSSSGASTIVGASQPLWTYAHSAGEGVIDTLQRDIAQRLRSC